MYNGLDAEVQNMLTALPLISDLRNPAMPRRGRRVRLGKRSIDQFEVLASQRDLFEVVTALHAPRSLSRTLHRREQQSDQYSNNGNHYQQFNESESRALSG